MTYLVLVFFLFGSGAISKSFAAIFQRFRFRVVLACIFLYGKYNSKSIFCPLNLSIVDKLFSSWILQHSVQVQKRKIRRRLFTSSNVAMGGFSSWSSSSRQRNLPKSVNHYSRFLATTALHVQSCCCCCCCCQLYQKVWSTCGAVVLFIKPMFFDFLVLLWVELTSEFEILFLKFEAGVQHWHKWPRKPEAAKIGDENLKEWSTNFRLEHSNGEVRTTFSDVLFPTKKFSLERPEKLQNSVSFLFMVNNRSLSPSPHLCHQDR